METIPSEWKVGKVTAIYKNKGDPTAWSQQRYLVMTSAFCKVLEAMLDHRLRCHFEDESFPGHWEEAQWGFRLGRGCAPQVYLLRRYIKQRMAQKQPTYVAFIDLWKAFPSTNRKALLVQLHEAGVRGSLWRMLQEMGAGAVNEVHRDGHKSRRYSVDSGLREGSVLSPGLFLVFINELIRRLNGHGKGPGNTLGAHDAITITTLPFGPK